MFTTKQILVAFCLALITIFNSPITAAPNGSTNPSWQLSESPSVRLGVRDKYGELGSYTAMFVVTSLNGHNLRASLNVKGSNFGYVTFPQDFGGPPNSDDEIVAVSNGKYSWVCMVNGKAVTKGRFEYSSTETSQRVTIIR